MVKKIILSMLVAFFLTGVCSVTYAGNFRTLAMSGWLKLGPDQAWEKSYDTENGKFKIRFRKLMLGSDAKRYHLIIWWNGKRIADGYSPEGSQYAFKIFEDGDTKRIFVMLETLGRAVVMGYEPNNQKLEKYIDSLDYYSGNLPYPIMDVDSEGDLRLSFSSTMNGLGPIRYKFVWNKDVNWFGYSNASPQVQRNSSYDESSDTSYDEDYEYEDYSSSGEATVETEMESAPTSTGSSSGELFYETQEVVGS
ncbi:hypothetical protein [Schwartzia succinivorans]|jgi:hypothetical protein|uniref:Uncharacterized protein n=1 Tax=Schwartzia succinivorans DSM 10502 TaxID=1123243 RepID=A0A1M5A7U3_9FIRM|nr:hypothetical protein [Schwartzia succinivorans]SHF25932.1 hypothetical protein SAMN02745190_02231 [Schwartzia succinivorans DSM 10502]